jgi:D-galactonate transporter
MTTLSGKFVEDAGDDKTGDALYRKITLRLIPFIFVCYIVNQIDRTNISFAKLQFVGDLGLTEAAYGLGAGLFFIGYVLFEVPSNLVLHRIGARKTLIRVMIFWGLMSMATCLVRTPIQLYIVRFLLGVAEAGFFPGIIYYLSLWYPSGRRARIMSLFVMGIPFAGIISSPVSGLILQFLADAGGLKGWQWMFLIEGAPAVLLGIAAIWMLIDHPKEAPWLSSREKQTVDDDLRADSAARPGQPHEGLREAVREPKVYVAAAVYFTIICGTNALILWMPTIIKEAGVIDLSNVGLFATIPWIAATIGMYLVGLSSDRMMERRWHVVGSILAMALSFLLLLEFAGNLPIVIVLLALAATGIYSAVAIFWTIPSAYLSGAAAAGGIAFISSIGGLGGFLSPSIIGWTKTATGSLYVGLAVVAAVLLVGVIVLLRGIPARILSIRSN